VPVELDVGDVVDVAVGGEDAVLVLAAEERDLDLLALVLVRVVLDGQEPSRFRMVERSAAAVDVAESRRGVVPVWYRESRLVRQRQGAARAADYRPT
jgi:hypothetical protein